MSKLMTMSGGSLIDADTMSVVRPVFNYGFTRPKNSVEVRSSIRYAHCFPGGYELVAVTSDGGLLCNKCCKENYYQIAYSRRYKIMDEWNIVGFESTAMFENGECCDHCNKWLDAYNDENTFNGEGE